jgi:hypothetical protein
MIYEQVAEADRHPEAPESRPEACIGQKAASSAPQRTVLFLLSAQAEREAAAETGSQLALIHESGVHENQEPLARARIAEAKTHLGATDEAAEHAEWILALAPREKLRRLGPYVLYHTAKPLLQTGGEGDLEA